MVVWCSEQALAGQHTTSLSSAEAELHEVVNGAARGLFIRNVLRALVVKAVMRVGTGSSVVAGLTQRLGARRVRHLEVKDLWIQEKVRSHELKISQVKTEDNRADLLTKFLDPERHHKLIKLCPLSAPGTRRGVANSASLEVVCSMLPVRATAGNQIETVEKINEVSMAARWLARGSRTQVVEFVEMTTRILWWARWMLMAGVGCWWLRVCDEQAEWCSENSGNTDGTQWHQ